MSFHRMAAVWESEEEDSSNVKMLKSELSMVAIRMLAIVELPCWRENIFQLALSPHCLSGWMLVAEIWL